MQETWVQSLSQEDTLEKWYSLQYSCVKVPWTEEPGGLLSMGSHRVRHDRSDLAAAAAEKERDFPGVK